MLLAAETCSSDWPAVVLGVAGLAFIGWIIWMGVRYFQ